MRSRRRSPGCALLSGCSLPGRQQDEGPKDTVDVSDAYFGLAWYKNGTLNPVTDTDSINAMLREALYEGLFELTDDFTPQNVLCEGYSGDGTTFTFTLRQGVKFWSGQTLTADDVVASYRAAMDNASSPYHSRLADVTTLESAGTYKVRIVLSSPNADFPRLLNIPVYRRGSADSGSFADGTRPYVPVENGSAYTLEKNENWHGGFLGTIRLSSWSASPGGRGGVQLPDGRRVGHAQLAHRSRRRNDGHRRCGRHAANTEHGAALYRHQLRKRTAERTRRCAGRSPQPSAAGRCAKRSFKRSRTRPFCRSIRSSRSRA